MSPLAQIHETATEVFASWHPDSPDEFDEGMKDLQAIYEEMGSALSGLSERLGSDFPIEPGTRESVAELGASTTGLADAAAEVYTTHRGEHETEMKRAEEPRPGEEMWDVRGGA
jgi:hypothetical protein